MSNAIAQTTSHCSNGLLYASWNQDQGCFACGMENGFRIYNTDPLKEKERQDFVDGGFGHVEMLYRCNYLALVGGGPRPKYPPNKVIIWDDLKKSQVAELEFSSDVRSVKLSRDLIVVILDDRISIFSFSKNPAEQHRIQTTPNPYGVCVLCPNNNNSLLAFPGTEIGHVSLVDLANMRRAPVDIPAHEAAVTCLAFNLQGSRLATASEKGTLIRVYDTNKHDQLLELRRGAANAHIYCIAFNHDSSFMCVSSDHGTVHVFASEDPARNKQSKMAKAGGLLPKYFSSRWSFAKFNVPDGQPCICAFGSDKKSIIAICADGSYFKYSITSKGECLRETFSKFLQMTDD
ncbi:PREDICTED: WD repeat domain phosphoinositide-interacting protein 3-like [Amphimedon queenslandica]|uniref:WD repeat domain phosphoinositide-interacting protein 3 n=1 Tax=Amphimedon queenslandica TaxID=400682 RepID=A0A1X7U8X5_AMPQE|nr:PREDICTED: WD repeat domain phosphoinositide-interacting protein 3-like [Amphimedon queenslandica]|eukprot:XP_003388703.1 PREDICTED: WD repeat domain phosphoinositide-interacting protein 3-like [Amphimedon queenslandica]